MKINLDLGGAAQAIKDEVQFATGAYFLPLRVVARALSATYRSFMQAYEHYDQEIRPFATLGPEAASAAFRGVDQIALAQGARANAFRELQASGTPRNSAWGVAQ